MKKVVQVLTLIILLSVTVYSQKRETSESINKQNPHEQLQQIPDDLFSINALSQGTSEFKSQLNDGFLLIQEFDILWDYGQSSWEHNRKYTYIYDQYNNRIEAIRQWTVSSEPIQKKTYYYDANNLLIEERVYNYENSEWVINKKIFYYYDGNNNLVQKTRQSWDGSQFENESNTDYTYDENNLRIYYIVQQWEDSNWINSLKFSYYYDENNNYYKIIGKYWLESDWVNNTKTLYTYDDINNRIMHVSYNWDPDISDWGEHSQRATYTYDQDYNNRIIFWLESWSESLSEWYYNWKTYYYYLPTESEQFEHFRTNLNKTIEDFQTTEDDLVIESGKEDKTLIGIEVLIDSVLHTSDGDLEFTLSHNDIIVSIIYQAGSDGDNFIGTKLTDNGIDSISNGVAPFAGNYKPENPISSFLETDPSGTWTLSIYDGVSGNTGTLQAWGINLIYVPDMGVESNLTEADSFEIFPNPANGKFGVRSLGFDVESCIIELYDLNGRKLVEKNIQKGTKTIEMDVSHLGSGIYFCKISTEKYSVAKKIIIQN